VPLDRLLELGLRSAGAKVEVRVERVQAEDVTVAPVARRRAGAAVAGRAEVVLALARRRLALTQPARSRIESPGGPVREDANRASGSSTTSANDRVPSGTFVQRSGGETSSSSQLWRLGIACALAKALLSRPNASISR
jgi:hypothetical protein